MKLLLDKLGISVDHLKCLDDVFIENNEDYKRIDDILNSTAFKPVYEKFSKELYAGGKTAPQSRIRLNRQMILGDVIEYIFSGRAYYHATKSEDNLKEFFKLIFYSVNQMLLFDTITINPQLRKSYIEKLEATIPEEILYEKQGDKELAQELKDSDIKIWQEGWKKYDYFIDSILPKTLGAPKELVVFAELIRHKIGIIIPLLLIQRIFGDKNPIAPPDFLILKKNKEIFGIEVGYEKEDQSREFTIRTSIPTFAIDLQNNMHNRCPKCGENILYCDVVINHYSEGTIDDIKTERNAIKKVYCSECPLFNNGNCKFSNYYGRVEGVDFINRPLEAKKDRHYHTRCVKDNDYPFNKIRKNIFISHKEDFFAQIPEIEGIANLIK